MKQELKQNIKIAIFGVLTLLLLILTVLELLPGKQTDLTIKESVTVSSSLIDTASGTYENAVSGILFNDSASTITVDEITVTVSNGKNEKAIKIPLALQMAPHTEQEISLSQTDTVAYSTVEEVTAQIGGESYSLANVQKSAIGAAALILIACLLVFGFLLYRSILVRYYMYQEKKIKE